ncbi:LOW QUALITY PROTEIN: breast cancer type 2 susceptibility protein homolog [Thrips palmi]|uniref:LOW QUALITY PROTEIN: breast cancer type 2 susceptibility protein homolog n=1 Tax=Thrips palmi TaxID=161013 RepID=A0A6P9A8H9_THRPL|nr:LOW QUALITY PROTEIN: breast cancer type 2 susceptibility protein homolog [Thrips palmi]
MEEDIDPFLDDEDSNGVGTQEVQSCSVDAENRFRENQTSPILSCSSSGVNSSQAGRRKGRIRRSGSTFQKDHLSIPLDPSVESWKVPPCTPVESLLLSQDFQSDFVAPKTPVPVCIPFKSISPFNDAQSDDDIFASPTCDEQGINPSALNALFNGPEHSDLSWSMVTPSANQASNTSWSNLNTEERKVLLPSDDFIVKPRALFLPDANDTADSWNMSSDAEGFVALKGQMASETPNYRRRKNSLVSSVPVESPLATSIAAEDSCYATPDHKPRKICLEEVAGSPILSGSSEFSKSSRDEKEEEDLFENEEECLVDMLPAGKAQDSKIAESTPHAGHKKETHADELNNLVTPHKHDLNNGESFLQDISVTALEKVCQAQELIDQAPPSTPEKQSETKRKRLLFSSNLSDTNHCTGTFKIPEAKLKEKDQSSNQEKDNDNGHCIPDDSFMEHLAAMNTSIFSDNLQPITKVQSIKTSVSKMKKFCYSADQNVGHKIVEALNTSEPKTLMKEILNSVIVLETTAAVTVKSKSVKASGDLVVFSQLQEEISKDLQEGSIGIEGNESSVPALEENGPPSVMTSILSPCQGFQTGSGKQVELSEEALSKGLSLLKDCMEAVDTRPTDKINAPKTSPITSNVPEASKAQSTETNLSDDVAAEEIKQLLQLVSDGEDFNPWHDTETISSPKSSKKDSLICPTSSKKSQNSPIQEREGFSTAGGKNIYVSDENLARAEKLLLAPESASTSSDENLMSNKNPVGEKCNEHFDKSEGQCEQNEEIHRIQSTNDVSISRKRRFEKVPNIGSFIVPMKKSCLGIADSPSSSNQNTNNLLPSNKFQEDFPCVSEAKTETIDKPLVNISQEAMNVVNNLIFNSSKPKDPPFMNRSEMGFSTASGGTINVSKNALDKVKNLFDNLPADFETESCKKSSVEFSTNGLKSSLANKDIKISFPSKTDSTVPHNDVNQPENVSGHTVEELTTAYGFSTASGKKVDVTEKAMEQAKNLFDDLSEADSKLELRTCAPKQRRSLGSFSKPSAQSTNKAQTPVAAAGSKSASSSHEELSKVKNMYDAIPRNPTGLQSKAGVRKVRRSLGSVSKHGVIPTSKAQTPVLPNMDIETENGGFSKASGKAVSEEAMKTVKNIFEDISNELIPVLPSASSSNNVMVKRSSIDLVGFSTAGGKTLRVSEEALNKARNLFDDLPSESSSNDPKPSTASDSPVDMPGFYTAGGSAVQISKEALTKARTLFDDLPSEPSSRGAKSKTAKNPCVAMTGFSTAGGSAVQISEEALNKAKTLFDDLPAEPSSRGAKSNIAKTPSVEMTGFSTAGGSAVQISKEALNRAKNLFDDVPSESLVTDANASVTKRSSADMAGFSTAGGRAVQVSSEALNRARNLFDDLPSESLAIDAKSHASEKPMVKMAGFSTAGGKAVQISEEALNKAKNFFDDLPSESSSDDAKLSTTKKSSVDMAGFSTAGGSAIQISKAALNKARNLFDDLPSEPPNSDVKSSTAKKLSVDMAGFSTAGGQAVQISKEALNRARNLFDDLPSESFETSAKSSSAKKPVAGSSTSGESANKENNFLHSSISKNNPVYHEMQKPSLTQEITESTAAILADDGFDLTRCVDVSEFSRPSISTSPSMVTDRSSGLKPIVSSVPENKRNASEPSSPILSRSNNGSRKRCRRGRLSLSTNTSSRTSPTWEICASSQDHHRTRLSLPSTVSSSSLASLCPTPDAVVESSKVLDRSSFNNATGEANTNDIKLSSKLPPSRKLFSSESDLSPAKLNTPNAKINSNVPSHIECNESSSVTPDQRSTPLSRPSHQNPLIRKALTKSLTTQSSGFKTPYKNDSKEQTKRSPSSPLQNPPEAKRMKPSTNLYISHVFLSTPGQEKSNPRDLRPEVAEMRRRAAEEQKQVVDNYAEHKGELLRPCIGGWLSRKINEKSCRKLMKMSAMGTPASCSHSELLSAGVRSSSIYITPANAASFRFSAWEYYSEDVCRENVAGIPVGDGALLVLDAQGFMGLEEFQRAFLASPGVDPSLVPSGWFKNHYRWLVWKLASLECHFPDQLGRQCFSPDVLMLQLKYRYDREIDRCERPALRRIFEHDDSAAKRMVLCVSQILNRDDASSGLELELTDGWYSVIASVDQDMQYRVKKGTIKIGTKLIMHNAELMNCSEGCFPLQVRDDVRLKLCSNSTRRARWYAKLGFQHNPGPINVPLGSILSSGGLVSCVTVYVARVYPLVFMEKTAEKTVVRSQRAESKEVAKCDKKREQLADKVYSQVQAELQQEQTKQKCSAKKFALKHVATLTSGEDLSDILENASDPLSVQSLLTEEQKQILSNYQRARQDELRGELESRVRSRLSDDANQERQVTPILKVRLFDEVNGNQSGAILSVWRPSEDMTSMFKEGHKLSIFSAVANGVRCGELQLSANRSTRYNFDNTAEINSNLIRCVTPFTSLSLHGFVPRFGEVDIVGIVIRISPAPQTAENPSHFQTAYLSDSHQNIVGIMFWGGMKEFGMDDLIVCRSFIAASNLQRRGNPFVKAVPCVYASELSFFTTNPKQQYLKTAQQELRCSVSADLKTFCQECEDKLDDLLSRKMSPAAGSKTPDSKSSVSKLVERNGVKVNAPNENSSLVSVQGQRKLSMEEQLKSPSASNILSPAVERRLASLERYGDSVPISPIFINQPRRSLRQDFKAPRRTDSPSVECKRD